MEGDKNIDKLFRERLQQDDPTFKEVYWKGFEKILTQVPPAPPASPASGIANIIASFTLTKGIITLISVIAVTSLVYFAVRHDSKDIPASFPATTHDTSVQSVSPVTSLSVESRTSAENIADNKLVKATADVKSNGYPVNTVNVPATSTGKSKIATIAHPENPEPTTSADNIETSLQDHQIHAENQAVSLEPMATGNAGLIREESVNRREGTGDSDKNDQQKPLIEVSGDDHLVETPYKKDELQTEPAITPEESFADSAFNAVTASLGNSNTNNSRNSKNSTPSKSIFYLVPGISLYETMGNPDDFSTKMKAAFQFGAAYSYQISKKFSVYAELNALRINGFKLTESSTTSDYLFYQWLNKVSVENREYNMVNIPVLARVHFERHSVGLGPVFRYIASSSGEKVIIDGMLSSMTFDNHKAENYLAGVNCLQSGVSLEYSMNVYRQNAILVRYDLIFSDFTKKSYYTGLTSKQVNLLQFALRFHIY